MEAILVDDCICLLIFFCICFCYPVVNGDMSASLGRSYYLNSAYCGSCAVVCWWAIQVTVCSCVVLSSTIQAYSSLANKQKLHPIQMKKIMIFWKWTQTFFFLPGGSISYFIWNCWTILTRRRTN